MDCEHSFSKSLARNSADNSWIVLVRCSECGVDSESAGPVRQTGQAQ
jgi:hypothetical protein